MADVVYNPLLKRNIQYLGGGSDVDAKIAALQNAINDLQSRLNDLKNTKITKVTAAAQLSDLTNGEIFEWQTTTTQQFTQGYFYQKNGNNYTRVDLQPQYNLPIAAADTLGGVKVGSGLDIDESGILSVAAGDNLKVPRCFTQAQINTLADNDIFQWQGETNSDFVNGYFYKKVVEHNIGDLYLHVATNHNISIYNGGSYSLNIGNYYNDSGATPIYNSTIHNAVFSNASGANCQFIFISNDEQSWSDVAVGDWVLFNNSEQNLGKSNVFQWVNNGLFYIAQLSEITRDGFGEISSFKIGTSSFTFVSRYGRITNYGNSIPVNINGVQTNVFYNDANNAALVFAPMANGKFAPVMIFETMAELETPIMGYEQTDTQPQPQLATTTFNGLMSAEDKSKLNNLTINQITIGSTLLCGRITGSGNYLEFFIPCALPSNASNLTLTITTLELYFDGTRPSLSYDSITTNSVIPLVGASFDLHLTSTQTPNKTFFVLINGTLTFDL